MLISEGKDSQVENSKNKGLFVEEQGDQHGYSGVLAITAIRNEDY